MAEYKRLRQDRFASLSDRDSSEAKFWRRFSTVRVEHLLGFGSRISFHPDAPHDFAVTCGARVALYSARSNRSRHALSRFGDAAFGGVYRADGKLMAAADGSGRLLVFDVARRNLLRSFRGHGAAAKAVEWMGNTALVSGSDDKSVRRWSLPTEDEADRRDGHADYVRALAGSPSSVDLWASGSYDHTVRLWDWRMPKAIAVLQHDGPVNALRMARGGGLLFAAAGNSVSVWDVMGGGRLVHSFSNHQKMITSLAVDATGQRLLTASLDGHVKVHSTSDYQVLHSMRLPAGVLALGIAPDDAKLCAALEDGSLLIRKRVSKDAAQKEKRRTDKLRGGTYSFFTRGKNALPTQGDMVVRFSAGRRALRYLRRLRGDGALDQSQCHSDTKGSTA